MWDLIVSVLIIVYLFTFQFPVLSGVYRMMSSWLCSITYLVIVEVLLKK